MIQSNGLNINYWEEGINCANYIVNNTPTKDLKNITPEEAWAKIKLDVSHFRVFGSIAWAHIFEGPSSFGVDQYLPYLAHQAGYQRLQATYGSKILRVIQK